MMEEILLVLWSIGLIMWLAIPALVIDPLGKYLERKFPNPPDGKLKAGRDGE